MERTFADYTEEDSAIGCRAIRAGRRSELQAMQYDDGADADVMLRAVRMKHDFETYEGYRAQLRRDARWHAEKATDFAKGGAR